MIKWKEVLLETHTQRERGKERERGREKEEKKEDIVQHIKLMRITLFAEKTSGMWG